MPRTPIVGAPGLYRSAPAPSASLDPERMDVCAFVGVTERGPARVPLYTASWLDPLDEDERERNATQRRSVSRAVESWAEFEALYGGFAGPGRLPYAVSAFFLNGGRRAVVVRIVHPELGLTRFASAPCAGLTSSTGAIEFFARDPGAWGNRLWVELTFQMAPLPLAGATITQLQIAPTLELAPGAVLRLSYAGGRALRHVVGETRSIDGRRFLQLDQPLPAAPTGAEQVEARLTVRVGEKGPVRERHERLGLSARHPRWLAKVLHEESSVLLPGPDWLDADLGAPADLSLCRCSFSGGSDDYDQVRPEDFFGDWVPSDPVQYEGVHCLTENAEVALLCVPDLYVPEPLPARDPPMDSSTAGPEFADCLVPEPVFVEAPVAELPLLRLDPQLDFETIVSLQLRLVELTEQLRGPVVLLDVPPGLKLAQVLDWRARFDSAFSAAYHPWLQVAPPDDRRDARVLLNPSAVAAGVIAARERQFGVPTGAANVVAAGVVDVNHRVSPGDHDRLHPQGINVFAWLPEGARLSAARTLSRDSSYRQLSVRRLMTLLARTLQRQLQWVVFEPNGRKLRNDLTLMVSGLLRRLHQQGAFTGARDEEAFFVKCDDELNPGRVTDAGQLIAHIGVAPAEPLEFIVLTVALEGGAISVEG